MSIRRALKQERLLGNLALLPQAAIDTVGEWHWIVLNAKWLTVARSGVRVALMRNG